MQIGIINCGDIPSKLKGITPDYSLLFIKIFSKIGADFTYKVYDAYKNQLPTQIESSDAYILTGSKYSAYDSFDWIESLLGFIRNVADRKIKIIGICFGHQVIAEALGGKVIKHPDGWGLGIREFEIIEKKSWMAPELDRCRLIFSHQDQVVTLPKHAEIIATDPFCQIQAYTMNSHILGIQGHPEFTRSFTLNLLRLREDMMNKNCYKKAEESLSTKCNSLEIVKWMANFLKS